MNITSTSNSISSEKHFGFWGDLRLSLKLMLAFSVMFVFALIIAGVTLRGLNQVQTTYEHALSQGGQVQNLSDELQIYLLQARRYEKNFILRWQNEGYDTAYTNYVIPYNENIALMHEHIKLLAPFGPLAATVSTGDMTQAQYEADIASLTQLTDKYNQSFLTLVEVSRQYGEDENTGFLGDVRNVAHDIEVKISDQAGLENLEITLLQIRRNEKDYLARKDQGYIDDVHTLVTQFKNQATASDLLQVAEKTELRNLAGTYQTAFDVLVTKDREIAEYDAAMIAAAREIEPLSTKIEALGEQLAAEDISTAQTTSTQTFTYSIITIMVVLALTIIVSIALSRQITRPVTSLTNTAEQIASGNFDVQAEVSSGDEVGLLAQTFNSMTSRLQQAFEEVRRRATELATVAEVGTATATILESEKLLQEVVNLSKERFNLYHSHIYLLDESGENLVLASGAGEAGRQMMAKGLSIPLNREQSLVARAARERKGVTVNDVTQAADFLPNALLPNTRSELAVPMIVGGKVIGVFDVQSDQVGRFTDSDINIQVTLASQVSTSIQNVRAFEQSKAQADLESLVNAIGQKIQRATTVDDTLQTAIREIGLALGASRVSASIASRQDVGNDSNLN
ncbi:MAG: HAMP domain-containing protein [Anaerolineales bacterium]|nr:HAMP domain-containing protein [Anaerolineales bacterium]